MFLFNAIISWISEIVLLISILIAFIYGLLNFFKKGKSIYIQCSAMAMGCYALGGFYKICQNLTLDYEVEGFTPQYLAYIGFFLFYLTASYGQMDKIVDDGSKKIRPYRYFAFLSVALVLALYIPIIILDINMSIKITFLIIWLIASISIYFSFKHSIIPDLDFGFTNAIRPYNISSTLLGFSNLIYLIAMNTNSNVFLLISSIIFAALCITTTILAKRGGDKWIL